MNLLVTGGLGYVGSHTVLELLDKGHHVCIVDNLSNSNKNVLTVLEDISSKSIRFHKIDICHNDQLEPVFQSNKFDAVLHFAGLKSVVESNIEPYKYYNNNVVGTLNIVGFCLKYNVKKIVFSSSATIYGNQLSPYKENYDAKNAMNPYGESKVMCEKILKDIAEANSNIQVVSLRYFNPIGAHKSGRIGDNPSGVPSNLMPYISRVASGKLDKLMVFGDDYDTVDGTGVRDYIHVVDVAKGHLDALNLNSKGFKVYNLGTGKGVSVLELINAFERVTSIEIPYEICGRRDNDIASCFADVSLASDELNWKATMSLDEMIRDAWIFEKNKTK